MKTFSNCTTTDLRNKVIEWREMTENNEHSELLCDMAIFMEMDSAFVDYFFKLSLKDHLTMHESDERYDVREAMMNKIKGLYGENIYNFICKAF